MALVALALLLMWLHRRVVARAGCGPPGCSGRPPRIYSPKSLELHVPGVVETKLGSAESAYRFRSDGLRLIQRSGDHYLLMSERWDARTSRIMVLRDTDAIRMEFAR